MSTRVAKTSDALKVSVIWQERLIWLFEPKENEQQMLGARVQYAEIDRRPDLCSNLNTEISCT